MRIEVKVIITDDSESDRAENSRADRSKNDAVDRVASLMGCGLADAKMLVQLAQQKGSAKFGTVEVLHHGTDGYNSLFQVINSGGSDDEFWPQDS